MATTLTRINATPYSLLYQLDGDNGAQGSRTGAQLVGDCVPGPLRALLAQFNAGNKLDHLNISAAGPGIESMGRARIRYLESHANGQTHPAARTLTWTANGITMQATAASRCQIEIRLANSVER